MAAVAKPNVYISSGSTCADENTMWSGTGTAMKLEGRQLVPYGWRPIPYALGVLPFGVLALISSNALAVSAPSTVDCALLVCIRPETARAFAV